MSPRKKFGLAPEPRPVVPRFPSQARCRHGARPAQCSFVGCDHAAPDASVVPVAKPVRAPAAPRPAPAVAVVVEAPRTASGTATCLRCGYRWATGAEGGLSAVLHVSLPTPAAGDDTPVPGRCGTIVRQTHTARPPAGGAQ